MQFKMKDRILDNSLNILRKFIYENMIVGSGGFSGSSSPEGPVAGFDSIMKLDGRSVLARKLPYQYRKQLILKKSKSK